MKVLRDWPSEWALRSEFAIRLSDRASTLSSFDVDRSQSTPAGLSSHSPDGVFCFLQK